MWLSYSYNTRFIKKKKTVSLCKTPLPYIALMHTLPLFCPTPCMPSPYSVPPHACPPLILSQPMHALPLFYPSLCTPSPYSIPAHAHPPPYSIPAHASPPPILSQPMHTLPLFYPSPCTPSPLFYPSPCTPSPLFYPSPCTPSPYSFPACTCHLSILFYSIPAHACHPNSLSHTPWRHVSPLTSAYELLNLLTLSISSSVTLFGNLEHHFIT